ncbi:MAG: MFS transporter, partial [Merismopedia sp. SIO2A8]|nr:MFS transporter [Merismopedia sp. SIO2A8]
MPPKPKPLDQSSTPSVSTDDSISSTSTTSTTSTKETEMESSSGFWPVLQNKNFLILWSGQVFSQLADKVYLVLMIAIIASRFQASDQSISGWVSALMITFTIPAVLFGFIAGVFVDRWPKQAVLVISNLLRGGLVIALPAFFWLTQGWSSIGSIPIGFFILLGATFLVSTLTQFFAPAEQAAIPLIVPRYHLLSANSLYTTTMMASVIVGFALGEPVLALADQLMLQISSTLDASILETGKEILVGGGYGIAGVILIFMQTQEQGHHLENNGQDNGQSNGPRLENGQGNGTSHRAVGAIEIKEETPSSTQIWADMKDGLRFLNQKATVRSALIQLIILFSIVAALAVLAVRLAEVIPVLDADQFGFLLAAGGVGMAIGAALLGQFGQRFSHLRLALMGSLGMSLCLLILAGFTQRLVPALICIGGLGVFAALIGIPMQTTIQAETPESMRGKVFGLQNNAVNIALSLPLALAGIAETFL